MSKSREKSKCTHNKENEQKNMIDPWVDLQLVFTGIKW